MMNFCKYGCGQEGKFQLKNGTWCCCDDSRKCPIRRKKVSERLKEKKKPNPRLLQENTTIICDFGCGSLARYIFLNGSFCCSKHYKECLAERDRCKKRVSGSENPMYGKTHTEEWKKKVGLKILGNKHNQNTKDKIGERIKNARSKKHWSSMIGKHHTEESKQKLRFKLTGRIVTQEFRTRCSIRCSGSGNPMYGKHQSESSRITISKKNKEKFCQKDFLEKWKRSVYRKKNKPESLIDNILSTKFSGYVYTGDYKVWIGGKNPDFLNEGKKKIIEFFGDYWHDEVFTGEENQLHENKRIEHFKKYGYDTLILRQKDLDNIDFCIQKILEFNND